MSNDIGGIMKTIKKLKHIIELIKAKPITPEEIDEMVKKAVSASWQKEFMRK